MELGILMTARCNASCTHCSTSCGPQRSEALPREKIISLMDEAAALSTSQPLKFYLSGGEPFLDFVLLLDVVAHGRRLGASVTCVTNASWATSASKARELLGKLKSAGLQILAVSSSPFHQQFIKLSRVETALAAAREVGLRCALKYVRTRADPLDEAAIEAWARSAGASEVQEIPLVPHLRDGEALAADGEYRRVNGLPTGRCPARTLTIREDGSAYTCCQPGGFNQLLRLGNANLSSLRDLRHRFYLGGVQQILREHGPIAFARHALGSSAGQRLRASYADVCDLCTHIGNHAALSAGAAQVAEDFEMRQVDEILRTLVNEEHP